MWLVIGKKVAILQESSAAANREKCTQKQCLEIYIKYRQNTAPQIPKPLQRTKLYKKEL